jgi:hypothetical protein
VVVTVLVGTVLVEAGLAPLAPDPVTPAPLDGTEGPVTEGLVTEGLVTEGLVELDGTEVEPAWGDVTPALGVADPPLLGVVVVPAPGADGAGGVVGLSPGSNPPARREIRLLTPTRSGFTSGSIKPEPGAGVDPDPPDTWGGSDAPVAAAVVPNPPAFGTEVWPPPAPPNG